MNRNTRGKIRRAWRWIRPMVATLIVLTAFRSSIADWNDVPTGSMEPSILPGDRIFVNKLAYGLRFPFTRHSLADWSGPQRGQIVVFFGPDNEKRMVKRVIGLPEDVIEMRGNRLIINGRPSMGPPATAAPPRP